MDFYQLYFAKLAAAKLIGLFVSEVSSYYTGVNNKTYCHFSYDKVHQLNDTSTESKLHRFPLENEN